jgi:nitroreductase
MLEVIKKRRSIRSYLDKEIEEEKIKEILKAAMFAPTAKNLRPTEFIIVKDKKLKDELSKSTLYSKFAKKAPLVIVICYDLNKGKRFREDCSIAAAHIYLEAVNQGLGTCFIQIVDGAEADVGDPEAFVKRLLNIPDNYRIQCLMPLGYPADSLPLHDDQEFDEERIHLDKFGSPMRFNKK